ncbi:MAG: hypothetical protein JSU63_03740 [Phycisphaerales bacterium]|nr:MAG: hypothetical protein JSU63_03740 [Phycisphaerales bacterium]
MAAVIAAAATLRLANLAHNSLTHDECIRANWSHHGDLNLFRWFPPGQLALLWTLQHGIARNEWVLRLPVALLGILAVYLCFSIMRYRIGNWAAVLGSAYLALHYHAVFYARAAKEIGYEPVLTLLLIWAGARAAESAAKSHIVVFFAAAVTGLLFGLSSIMVATAWGLLILWSCWNNVQNGRRNLRLFLVLTVAFVPLVLAWYVWVSGCTFRQGTINYMGERESAWPAAYSAFALMSWGLRNSLGLLRFSTGTLSLWQPIGPILLTVGGLLAFAGIGELWRRWPMFVKFAGALIAVNVVLAVAKKWPFGDYRMSVFLLPVFAPLFGCGLAYVLRNLRSAPACVFLLLAWFIPAASQAASDTIVDPREYDHARPVVNAMRQHVQPGDAVLVYYAAGFSFDFYWSDPGAKVYVQDLGSRGRYDLYTAEFDTLARSHPRVWVFFTHVYGDEGDAWAGYALAKGQVVHEFKSVDAFAYCVEIPAPTVAYGAVRQEGPQTADIGDVGYSRFRYCVAGESHAGASLGHTTQLLARHIKDENPPACRVGGRSR